MEQQNEILLTREEIRVMIRDLESGAILIIEVPVERSEGEENTW